MSTTTLSPLRQRMIEDMSLRNLAPRTQEAYIRGCRKLAAFLRRSPDTATAEDIRLFQLHLAEQGVSICTRNRTMTGIAFLFRVTLRRPEIADGIEYIAEPQKIPLVLSPEEVRRHGAAWREANRGHVSLGQLKVMSAIERCRTAALGGHVARCENDKCAHTIIGYNSCRDRHCPKCQGAAAREWLAEREAELLRVPYFHVVYTLPAPIADIAYQNKHVIYDLLFKASAETTLTIAADP